MTKLTVAAAKRKFHSLYHVALVLDVYASTVTRWGKYVPDKYVPTLNAHPGGKLKRGGPR